MANIEKIIEKLEAEGFVEIVIATNDVFWQKKDVKVYLKDKFLIASIYDLNLMQPQIQHFSLESENIFKTIETISKW